MITASVIDAVMQILSPNVSVAHRTTSSAGAPASDSAASVASLSMRMTSSRRAGLTGRLRFPQSVAGMSGRSCGNAIRRLPLAGPGPPRRSRGSRTERRAPRARRGRGPGWAGPAESSCQVLLPGPGGPGGERLARHPAGVEAAQHPLDVVGQLVGGGLEAPDLPAEAGAFPVPAVQASSQVHLESFHLLTAREGEQRSLEADVRGLDPGARVGAAV